MKSLLKSISNQPIFIGMGLILILLILTTQYQFWFGDYSRSDLEKIKEEISVVEKEIEIIRRVDELIETNVIHVKSASSTQQRFGCLKKLIDFLRGEKMSGNGSRKAVIWEKQPQ